MSAAHTSVPEVLDALKDVTYPAGKEQLVSAARRAGASDEVVAALRGIPAEGYAGRAEVARSVRVDPDPHPGRGAGRRTRQARRGGKPGVSQHLREEPRTPIQEEFDR
jgi:cation diffusion facilitator CzcD-associated flavoprotein CzcO